MTRLLLVLSTFVFTTFYATASTQSYTFNESRAPVPTATVKAANSTVHGTSKTRNSTVSSAGASKSDEDSDDDDSSDSDDDSDSSSSDEGKFTFGDVFNVTSTTKSTYKNWIGPSLVAPITACYREAHIAKTCPVGFDKRFGVCWAQCPLAFPVECGMECIRQNDDCALEITTKISTVGQAFFTLATYDMYGKFKLMAKGIQIAYKCGKEMMGLVRALSRYIRIVQVANPQTPQDQLLTLLYHTDNVVFDIPVTIATCLGIKVDEKYKFMDRLVNTAELILRDVLINGDAIVSSWPIFTRFMHNVTLGETIRSLKDEDITSLKSALESDSTCGYNMKRLLDRTWMTVAEMRRRDPKISEDAIRVAMSKSQLSLYEIPTVTNNCMTELIADSGESAAYSVRDTLRKGIGSIMDDLVKSGTSNNGTLLTAGQYAYAIADKMAAFYAVWDRKKLGGVMAEFFQPICGPTEFVGEIDDGPAKEALGLRTVEAAFNNSSGSWTRKGDGSVGITFESTDTEDVTVHIKSGGNLIDKVFLVPGKTVTWRSKISALGGKTLYLDRWRRGFLGFPGSGGGSLLLWVPRSSQGGNLQLAVKINVS